MRRNRDVHVHFGPAACVTAVLSLLVLGLASASNGATDAGCNVCTPIVPPPAGKVIARISFASGKPRAWRLFNGSRVSRSGKALSVNTSPNRYTYVLGSPPLTVTPGKYSIRLYGKVTGGGMTLGVLTVKGPPWGWRGYANYAAHEARMGQLPLSTKFTVRRPMKVQVMLANYSPGRKRSSWTLRRLSIVRND